MMLERHSDAPSTQNETGQCPLHQEWMNNAQLTAIPKTNDGNASVSDGFLSFGNAFDPKLADPRDMRVDPDSKGHGKEPNKVDDPENRGRTPDGSNNPTKDHNKAPIDDWALEEQLREIPPSDSVAPQSSEQIGRAAGSSINDFPKGNVDETGISFISDPYEHDPYEDPAEKVHDPLKNPLDPRHWL